MVLMIAWVGAVGVLERKAKKKDTRREEEKEKGKVKGGECGVDGKGQGGGRRARRRGLEDFEPVPWDEYEEGRPTRPVGFEFVIRERAGWRERLGLD